MPEKEEFVAVKVYMPDFLYEDYERYIKSKGLKLVQYTPDWWTNPDVPEYYVVPGA